jgi:hypothetical protein
MWVRSLLAVYRQAALDATREGVAPVARQQLIEELGRIHILLAVHEELEGLWRDGFGGTEAGVRMALAPLVESALRCSPDTPMRAVVEFAAEEIAALFESV